MGLGTFPTVGPSSALLPFFGEGSLTEIDNRKKGTLILTSLLEDLASGTWAGSPFRLRRAIQEAARQRVP